MSVVSAIARTQCNSDGGPGHPAPFEESEGGGPEPQPAAISDAHACACVRVCVCVCACAERQHEPAHRFTGRSRGRRASPAAARRASQPPVDGISPLSHRRHLHQSPAVQSIITVQ